MKMETKYFGPNGRSTEITASNGSDTSNKVTEMKKRVHQKNIPSQKLNEQKKRVHQKNVSSLDFKLEELKENVHLLSDKLGELSMHANALIELNQREQAVRNAEMEKEKDKQVRKAYKELKKCERKALISKLVNSEVPYIVIAMLATGYIIANYFII